MLQVEKFVLAMGEQEIDMPDGAQILSVELSISGPAVYALVDPAAVTVQRAFAVVQNHEELPDGVSALHYRGTAKVTGGPTFHVFETTKVEATA